ncbi:MAG: hemerythrin domain-containing protein, partial [Alphaproteobacteria bacterium]|nr:hemerythrin domain-containing protein [Alphaproteobacteria bacterium]
MRQASDNDACDVLDADHLAVKHLFVEYARLRHAADGDTAEERNEIAHKVCRELTVHAQIEEEMFYPALR